MNSTWRISALGFAGLFPLLTAATDAASGVSGASGVSASAAPLPSPPPVHLNMEMTPLAEGEIPEEVSSMASSEKLRVLRLRITNPSDHPVLLLWGDFLVRHPGSERWIGGWWENHLGTREKMEIFTASPPAGKHSFIPPKSALEYMLVDPWAPDVGGLEYKFACLVSIPTGQTALFETPEVPTATVSVDRSGVELMTAGVSSAIGKLVSSDPPAQVTEPGSLGVTLVHTPVGPVEVGKNPLLKAEASRWSLPTSTNPLALFHVYRTEVVNNTQDPLRLVMMEASTSSDGKWLTGHLRPPLMGEAEIVASSYLEKTDTDGTPTIVKMTDGWVSPGDRVIFPALWHAAKPAPDPALARWRALLVSRTGKPVYAEGVTPACLPTMPVVQPAQASPSPDQVKKKR